MGPGSRALPGFTTQVLGGGVGSLMCPWRRWGVAGVCAHLLVGSGCRSPQLVRPGEPGSRTPCSLLLGARPGGFLRSGGLQPAPLLAELGVPALPATLPTLGCSWRPPAGKARGGPAAPREASGPVPGGGVSLRETRTPTQPKGWCQDLLLPPRTFHNRRRSICAVPLPSDLDPCP